MKDPHQTSAAPIKEKIKSDESNKNQGFTRLSINIKYLTDSLYGIYFAVYAFNKRMIKIKDSQG
jgi:hypothetical protein